MKIVKVGIIGTSENWKTEVICRKKDKFDGKGCGAVLEVTTEDLVMMYWEGTHFTHHYSAVRCPLCGKYNKVKVPDPVWEKFNTAANRKKAVFDGFSESIY